MLLLTTKGKVLNIPIWGDIHGTRINAIILFASDVSGKGSAELEMMHSALREQYFTGFPPVNCEADEKLALEMKGAIENMQRVEVNPLQKIKEEDMVLPKKEAEQVRVHMKIKVPNVEAFKNRINELNEERKTQATREGKLGYIQAKDDRSLTDQEKEVLSHISSAFNAFVELDSKGIHDDEDFKNAANAMHRIIALRVARRVDPDAWN